MKKSIFSSLYLMTLILAAVMHYASPAYSEPMDDEGSSGIEMTRTTLEEWVETRKIISNEKRDFEFAKEMLSERIELVEREIEALKTRIRAAEESITEADQKRGELLEQNERLKEASSSLKETVDDLEVRTKTLLSQLPDPIRERIKPLSQRFPENPGETKMSLSERFQNIIGVLNEINKFNREITMTSEVRDLPDGSSVEVTALYVGIGQGYYVSAKGDIAGVGTVSKQGGWGWKQADKAADEIREVISILKNETVAKFVQLPVEIL